MSKLNSEQKPAMQTIEELVMTDENNDLVTLQGTVSEMNLMSKEEQNDALKTIKKFKYQIICTLVYRGIPTHHLAKTRQGDRFFIRLSCRDRTSGVDDSSIHISKTSLMSYVPPSMKGYIIDSKKLGMAGAVFICDESICIVDIETTYSQNTFDFEEQGCLFSTNKDSIVSYPVVNLFHLATSPFDYENKILKASQLLTTASIQQLTILEDDTVNAINILLETRNAQIKALSDVKEQESKVANLTEVFMKVSNLDPSKFPKDIQKEYERLLKDLSKAKGDLHDKIDRLGLSHVSVGLINSCEYDIYNSLQIV